MDERMDVAEQPGPVPLEELDELSLTRLDFLPLHRRLPRLSSPTTCSRRSPWFCNAVSCRASEESPLVLEGASLYYLRCHLPPGRRLARQRLRPPDEGRADQNPTPGC